MKGLRLLAFISALLIPICTFSPSEVKAGFNAQFEGMSEAEFSKWSEDNINNFGHISNNTIFEMAMTMYVAYTGFKHDLWPKEYAKQMIESQAEMHGYKEWLGRIAYIEKLPSYVMIQIGFKQMYESDLETTLKQWKEFEKDSLKEWYEARENK